ncbi:MAG: hypothetical protein ABSH11_12595 [Verrucomicrobiota bacterium]|jgi:hypothetical protein
MKSRVTIINLTVLLLVIFFASLIWMGFSATYPFFTLFVYAVSLLSLVCLFFVNLGFAVFKSKQRMAHIIMSLLIIVAFCGIFPLCIKWGGNTQRQWFIQRGIQTYQPMADKVMQNKAKLTDSYIPLDTLVGRSEVYGHTNADGSITIKFRGRNNYMSVGYLYYSGNKMTVKPGDTNLYFIANNLGYSEPNCYYYVHLTNGWYEY